MEEHGGGPDDECRVFLSQSLPAFCAGSRGYGRGWRSFFSGGAEQPDATAYGKLCKTDEERTGGHGRQGGGGRARMVDAAYGYAGRDGQCDAP